MFIPAKDLHISSTNRSHSEPLTSKVATDKTNIVLTLADDMGYSGLGCYGCEVDTPNSDGVIRD